jgi:hypothetical protein
VTFEALHHIAGRLHRAPLVGPPRARRIFKLSCRRRGADCETCVGAHDPSGGETVRAIFDVDVGYAILWRGGHEIVAKRQTYPAVEFD